MPAVSHKRKRVRKACIPCHQRKRKCDTDYPCGMCSTYGYHCRYSACDTAETAAGVSVATAAERVHVDNDNAPTNRAITASYISDSGPPISQNLPEDDALPMQHPGVMAVSVLDTHNSETSSTTVAAMAFPHVLGRDLGGRSNVRMHSFAYNFGTRPDETSQAHGSLKKLISADDLAFFSEIYFSVMAPFSDFIDQRIFIQRCRECYHESSVSTTAFEAVAAGIAALGAFLSSKKHPRETELVQYAKAILDDPASMRILGIDHIIAWALRVLYLRATSRPENAWIASCTHMHLCNAIGLHDESTIVTLASRAGAASVGHDADRLRRIFWISWAGHQILSYEYDLPPVGFGEVTCQAIPPVSGSVADQFLNIAQIIPVAKSPSHLGRRRTSSREELFECLEALSRLHTTHPFLILTKADLSFCFYRRMYQLKTGIANSTNQLVIDIGNAAIEAAKQLAQQGHLLWNIIGSVFQYTCVLCAINTVAAFAHVAAAVKTLESFVRTADTDVTREALSMARHLLRLSIEKKRHELAALEAAEAGCHDSKEQLVSCPGIAMTDTGWDWDLDQFLFEPYSSLFGSNTQM